MTNTDKPAFVTAISALFEAFGKEITEARVAGYWLGLRDLAIQDVTRAVTAALTTETFLPVPASLRKLAGVADVGDRAQFAWEAVLRAVADVGPYRHVTFADQTINAAIRGFTGSWVALCDRFAEGESQERWIRKEFVQIYAAYARRQSLSPDETKWLGGLSQVEGLEPVEVTSRVAIEDGTRRNLITNGKGTQ